MEDDSYNLLLLIAIIVVCIGLFLGLSTLLRKSFSNIPENDTSASTQTLKEQRTRMKETEERRKRLMDDQRQKLKDMQR